MKTQTGVNPVGISHGVKSRRSKRSRKNRLNRELKKELGKKLLGYSATAGAVLSIGAAAASAAPIRFTPVAPISISIINDHFDLDFNDDAVNDLHFSVNTSFNSFLYNKAYVGGGYFNKIVDTTSYSVDNDNGIARNLSLNIPINAALLDSFGANQALLGSFAVGGTFRDGNFLGDRGFLGAVIEVPGGSPHFVWVDLALSADASEITIFAWGYNDEPNAGILAGEGQESQPVPEPATLLTLAMGVSGIYAWRRYRNRKGLKNAAQKEYQNA